METKNVDKALPSGTLIVLGGKPRELKCTNWALALVEETTGESLLSGKFFANFSMNKVLTMAWAFLQHDTEVNAVTMNNGSRAAKKMIADWLPMENFVELNDAVMNEFTRAAQKATPEKEPVATEPALQSGTGSSS